MPRALPHQDDHPAAPWLRPAAALLLLLGLLLRLFFLYRHAFLAGDSLLYQDIASNWLHAHIYGLSTDAAPRPTLIRLPGYPAILAVSAWLFDGALGHPDLGTLRGFLPVLYLQILVDLVTCWLTARIASRLFGSRAFLAALALACLCPFTANYTAVPLTETFTLFFLALAFRSLQRWLDEPTHTRLAAMALTLSCSILLRPDQGLLAAAILPAIFFCKHGTLRSRTTTAVLCISITTLPFLPWTARNWRTFHVFQPLAPKLANDPGEVPPLGFQRWFRTWAVDFSATQDAYWNYPEDAVRITDLPSRAFNDSAEYAEADALLKQAAFEGKLNPKVESAFATLAAQRIHAHPLRYYVTLPAARLFNMLFHPRTEMLPVPERWWQFRQHPAATNFAAFYAAWSAAYMLLGLAGFRRTLQTSRILALSMAAYILLRCALLLTLDNAEQRYTLEFFPIWIIFASSLFSRFGLVSRDESF